MKKIVRMAAVMLLMVVTISARPFAVLAQPSAWAAGQVNQAIELGLVPPSLQSNYMQTITRAEFCALAVALYEAAAGEITGRVAFDDTDDVNVEKAASVGIVSGVGNNRFAPGNGLNREQAAVMLAQLAAAVGKPLPQWAPLFADNDQISLWAVDGVGQTQMAAIMTGTSDTKFSPKMSYTREQSIATIMRMYGVVMGAGDAAVVSVPLNSLPLNPNLKKGMTDAEFQEAYNIALGLVRDYAGLSKLAKVELVYWELKNIRHGQPWTYSMEDKHYSDVYGFFKLNRTSCAGDVRAAALCLTILGVPYEHVNENQYAHQWIRLALDGQYVIMDVNAPALLFEEAPYKHPYIVE